MVELSWSFTQLTIVLSPKLRQTMYYSFTGSIKCVNLWANHWSNIYERVYVNTHTHTHTHIQICIYIYIYERVSVNTHTLIHTHNTQHTYIQSRKLEYIIYFLIFFSVTSFSTNGLSLQFKFSDTVKTFQAQKYERCDLKKWISIAMTIIYLSISRLFLLSL